MQNITFSGLSQLGVQSRTDRKRILDERRVANENAFLTRRQIAARNRRRDALGRFMKELTDPEEGLTRRQISARNRPRDALGRFMKQNVESSQALTDVTSLAKSGSWRWSIDFFSGFRALLKGLFDSTTAVVGALKRIRFGLGGSFGLFSRLGFIPELLGMALGLGLSYASDGTEDPSAKYRGDSEEEEPENKPEVPVPSPEDYSQYFMKDFETPVEKPSSVRRNVGRVNREKGQKSAEKAKELLDEIIRNQKKQTEHLRKQLRHGGSPEVKKPSVPPDPSSPAFSEPSIDDTGTTFQPPSAGSSVRSHGGRGRPNRSYSTSPSMPQSPGSAAPPVWSDPPIDDTGGAGTPTTQTPTTSPPSTTTTVTNPSTSAATAPTVTEQPRISNPYGKDIANVDPRLVDIVTDASKYLPPGYSLRVKSGKRNSRKSSQHDHGRAMDVQIIDPKGNVVPDYQNPVGFRLYEQLAQNAKKIQTQKYPDLNNHFRWGGYFSGNITKKDNTYGAMDLMHFDIGRGGVMGAGSWSGGLDKKHRDKWGVTDSQGMGNIVDYQLPTVQQEEPPVVQQTPAQAAADQQDKLDDTKSVNPFLKANPKIVPDKAPVVQKPATRNISQTPPRDREPKKEETPSPVSSTISTVVASRNPEEDVGLFGGTDHWAYPL